MNLGQAEDYAVRALVDLVSHRDARVREISSRTAIPGPHLSKVIQALARSGLVETTRGRVGGVRLARAPEEINIREVVEAVQGPLRLTRCPRRGQGCPLNPDCRLFHFWTEFQRQVELQLERVHLAELAQSCSATLVQVELR